MTHTSAFCRAQEGFHRDRAAMANLDAPDIVEIGDRGTVAMEDLLSPAGGG